LVKLNKKTAFKSAIFSLGITAGGFGQDEAAFKAGCVVPTAVAVKKS
jgi:hypothetical protein